MPRALPHQPHQPAVASPPTSIVIHIRGCAAAGKTTLVRRLMEAHGPPVPIERAGVRKHEGYQLGPDVRVVGDYRTRGAPGYDQKDAAPAIEGIVREYARRGSVVFEGLYFAEQVTRWRQLALDLGNVVFAFLRPPFEVCVERRRAPDAITIGGALVTF